MHGLGSILSSAGVVITGGVLAPALFLHFRAGGDPEWIIDGLLRLSWWWPLMWLLGVYLWAERRLGRTRRMLAVQMPLLLLIAFLMSFWFGWRNDGAIIVSHEPTRLTRSERNRKARGEDFYNEANFGWVAPLAKWAHERLPPHPFGSRN